MGVRFAWETGLPPKRARPANLRRKRTYARPRLGFRTRPKAELRRPRDLASGCPLDAFARHW